MNVSKNSNIPVSKTVDYAQGKKGRTNLDRNQFIGVCYRVLYYMRMEKKGNKKILQWLFFLSC